MGAANFAQEGYGTTAAKAFADARERALWEHGHGGYSGTLAEKRGFVLFLLPPRWTAAKLDSAVWAHESILGEQEYARMEAEAGRPRHRQKEQPWQRKARAESARLVATLGDAEALRLVRVARDKWGDAVGVEVSAAEARAYKARHHITGRGIHVYRFFGLASC